MSGGSGGASPRACFVTASGQNVFFEELMDAIRAGVERLGVPTEVAVDHFPALRDDVVYVFVPHESIPLMTQAAYPHWEQLVRSVAVTTEQPHTTWFTRAAEICEHTGAVIDIHPAGVAELRRLNIPARHMTLGYVPEWDHWGGDEAAQRPIDVTFMGGFSDRRASVLGSCAPVLRRRRCSLHVYETHAPHTADDGHFFARERKWEHLKRSRVIVNVHRDENHYFEWQRVMGAIENGCIVVTEHSTGYEPLIAGEHFVSVEVESLPHVLDALLDDEERLALMRREAYEFVRRELPLDAQLRVLVDAIHEVAARPMPEIPRPLAIATASPAAPERRLSEAEKISGSRDDNSAMRMAIKRMYFEQRELRRELRSLRDGDAPVPEDAVQLVGPRRAEPPRVSVVVSLYNYERQISDAISSVALSEYEDLELVLVEDKSIDRSLDAAYSALAAAPWLSATVIARGRNGGLPRARNLGIEHARGELVFVLDADNAVYPHALGRLVEALDANPSAAMAYGLIETFDPAKGPASLLSWLPWDRYRFRYGNYIDAMALIRRSALDAVGGFTADPRLYGWEDYALWCDFAERGMRGAHVPEILSRYRTGRHSMVSISDIDAAEAFSVLHDRFPILDRVP